MRRDKATIDFGGEPLAKRVARVLAQVAYPLLAVGNEAGSGLETIDDPREGPLVAFVAGADALRARGHDGAVLLVACDLPFMSPGLLAFVAASLGDGHDAAVPILRGREQPLAACYAPPALAAARALVHGGANAMRDLLRALDVRRVEEDEWTRAAPPRSLADVDTRAALLRARIVLRAARGASEYDGGDLDR
jgi:molybdopterin-guanine dinucleotide biosynthesis protein A